MTIAVPETADDLFLRLGSQPFFHTPLLNSAGQTSGTPAPATSPAADDLFLALGQQADFRTALLPAGPAPTVDTTASANLANAARSLNPMI